MFFNRVISNLLPGYEHSGFHRGHIAFLKKASAAIQDYYYFAAESSTQTAIIRQMPQQLPLSSLAISSRFVDRDDWPSGHTASLVLR